MAENEPAEGEVVGDETTALAPAQAPLQRPISIKGGLELLPVEEQKAAMDEYDLRRDAFRKWLLSKMVQGLHYGVPPGCEPDPKVSPEQWKAKPMLYKAGAQFVADLCRLKPVFAADMDGWKQGGGVDGHHYRRCVLIDRASGEELGEGYGMAAVGSKKRDGNAAIKVGNKCALSDAILNVFALSDLFVQDGPPGNDGNGQPASASPPSGDSKPAGPKPPEGDSNYTKDQRESLWQGYRDRYQAEVDAEVDAKALVEAFRRWAESILRRDIKASSDIASKDVATLRKWLETNGLAQRSDNE